MPAKESALKTAAAVMMVPLLIPGAALANGINPPQPAAGVIVRADCIREGAERPLEIYRAQLRIGAEVQSTVEARTADGVEEIALGDLRTVRRLGQAVDKAGFVPVDATRADGVHLPNAALRVRRQDDEIELIGFSRFGARVGVPLSKCAELHVARVNAGDVPVGSGAKKR
jgi:hypothetical protein